MCLYLWLTIKGKEEILAEKDRMREVRSRTANKRVNSEPCAKQSGKESAPVHTKLFHFIFFTSFKLTKTREGKLNSRQGKTEVRKKMRCVDHYGDKLRPY